MRYIKPPDFKSVKDLQEHYKKLEQDITDLLFSDASINTAEELNKKLSLALSASLSYLTKINKTYVEKELPIAFKEGQASSSNLKEVPKKTAAAILAKQGFKYAKNGFSYDTYIELQTATKTALNGIKTQVNDIIKDLRKDGQDSLYNVRETLLKELQQHGLTKVKYSNGAEMPLNAYAAMAARSARIESTNIGSIGSALQNGTDLVKMTSVPQCCRLCGAYQGKVYSITGKDKRFPSLFNTVLKNGYALPHPNCRHEFIPWFEETEDPEDVERAIKNSKIKYDSKGNLVDVRYQKEIEAYQAWQAGNRQRNREMLEFEQMQAYYKGRENEMPYKTLGAFRRARRADNLSSAFKAWRYRERDKKQYEEWVKKLGKENMPEDIDKFVDIKYNDIKEYQKLKIAVSDVEIKAKFGTKEYPLVIHQDRQGKHIKGHKNFIEDNSYLVVNSVEEGQLFAQKLVDNYSGKGNLLRDRKGRWNNQEEIEIDIIVGYVLNKENQWIKTNKIKFHYSKNGVHIVPTLRGKK